jgi:plastocyanin
MLVRRSLASLALILATIGGLCAATGGRHVVGQKNKKFSESEITVRVGDTVVFVNDDDIVHNVYSRSECCKFNVKAQAPGTSSAIKFDKPGTVEVRCAIHPKMKLKIHVQ